MTWAAIVGKLTGTVDQHLVDRIAYLLAENRVLRGRVDERIRFTDAERIELAKAARPLGRSALAEIATIVTPDTLLRWHRRLVEKKIPTPRGKIGRPPTEDEIIELVLQFASGNPSWGYDRIAGALKELGHDLSDSTVGNILKQNAQPPAPERKKGTTWTDFIAAHKNVLVACDFFTKEVWTLTGLVNYYVLFFVHIASRKIYIAGFTANPNETWMKQIARNLTMADGGFLNGMKYLILDRDGKFALSFRALIESAGVEMLRLPPRSPNLNAFAERFVRSIKEECLDHLILFGEASLQRALDNYIEHYHHERPHQGKKNIILFPTSPVAEKSNSTRAGPVECKHRLGGLLKFYRRQAA
jgi:putative transposase